MSREGSHTRSWAELLNEINLSDTERAALRTRLVQGVEHLRWRVRLLGLALRLIKTLVTAGALLVPSLVSLQPSSNDAGRNATLSWLVWAVGLTTSFGNASISLFSMDRKYFTMRDQLCLLETEMWLFLTCSGRYHHSHHDEEAAHGSADEVCHRHHLNEFMERCEAMIVKASRAEPAPPVPPSSKRLPNSAKTFTDLSLARHVEMSNAIRAAGRSKEVMEEEVRSVDSCAAAFPTPTTPSPPLRRPVSSVMSPLCSSPPSSQPDGSMEVIE